MFPRMIITPEIAACLQNIDAIRDEIRSRPVPPESVLRQLEQEFLVDAALHSQRLDRQFETVTAKTFGRYPRPRP